jgi:hypothetical protein
MSQLICRLWVLLFYFLKVLLNRHSTAEIRHSAFKISPENSADIIFT